MNIQTAIAEVKKAAAAGLPVLLLGSPGIGKTTVASILAAELGLPYVEIRAAEFEAVDFRGIPTVVDGRTVWNTPDFWPSEPCLLNFDEVTQAPMELTSPLLKIFLGGAIGDYKLPAGTILMATGNLVSDRAGCSRLSSALRERCVVIHLEADFASWRNWFYSSDSYDEQVDGYLVSNPSQFHQWEAKNDYNQPTPRNWARVGKLAKLQPAEETLAGIIGPVAAKNFAAWCRANVRMPSVEAVLNGSENAPVSVAQKTKFVELVAKYVADKHIEKSADKVDAAAGFVSVLESTYQVQFLKHLVKHDKKLLHVPAVTALVKRHAAAIVQIV
jgi:DNA polymerase III delta prime subunit